MEGFFAHNAYGFRFTGEHQNKVVGLNSIGYELQQEHSYQWNGLTRNENNIFIFQYTLKGQGAIRIKNKTYTLNVGDAFFVQVPSDHNYYLPQASDEWEFLYFTVFGEEASRLFNQITKNHGHIFTLPLHSEPIKHIFKTLETIETTGITNSYIGSIAAYSFIMKCVEYFEYGLKRPNDFPISIVKATQFIEKNYKQDITLEDIVEISKLSKYHFTRQFKKYVNETPINYLTNIRITNALPYLSQNNVTIDWIAQEVGFRSTNYFSKVFKKKIGISPSKYRKDTTMMSVNKIFTD